MPVCGHSCKPLLQKSHLHATQPVLRLQVFENMAIRFHPGRALRGLSWQTIMLPPADSCHLFISCMSGTLSCPSSVWSLCFNYIFIRTMFIFRTLLYFTVFNLNYRIGLIITTISQRGKGTVMEIRWWGQNHTTSKWGGTVHKNIDHMLDQEQRREKLTKLFVY